MDIKICTTAEWSENNWLTYCDSFNTVFEKKYDLSYFKQKYTETIDAKSYHALLLNENMEVVGGCSAIPYLYIKEDKKIRIGQAVDVFILEEFRTDPLMLRRMYMQLKKLLIAHDISVVMAVPNATAYPYWKNIVKWNDVGDLTYWMLPIRIGNIINKWHFLNCLSLAFSYISLVFNALIMSLCNNKEKESLYELIVDDAFLKYRYPSDYYEVIIGSIRFYYRVYYEDGVQTAYLLDVMQNGKMSYKGLFKGVSYIIRKTKSDLILYIGPLRLFQTLLIKVPKKFKPKRLPLTCDILNKEDFDIYKDMLVLKNWNFGLKNYDVR